MLAVRREHQQLATDKLLDNIRLVSIQGVFCGDCLYMRYGENVDEANADAEWTCPHCRDTLLCNCSQHRSRRGWAPTGALYRKAIAMGALSQSSSVPSSISI